MLQADRITYSFGPKPVLDRVSIHVAPGEIVGLSGPSGAGKSTLARILAGHLSPHQGEVTADGAPLPAAGFSPVQMLFQSPEMAVNPRWRIRDILNEAFSPDAELLDRFDIDGSWLDRYPHEISGGELQRVTIVRCLDPRTRYIVADEISAMLDPITQATMWRTLLAVARERRLGLLMISHDQPLITRIADRQMVLSDGIREEAEADKHVVRALFGPGARSPSPQRRGGVREIAS
jgi:peptide/nickel transport system ATP-binding protein